MSNSRAALLIGIDHYHSQDLPPLGGCCRDASAMAKILSRHESGQVNYDCRCSTSGPRETITKVLLRQKCSDLFKLGGELIFYFAGHGSPTETGGVLATQDGQPGDWGIPMSEVLQLANQSTCKSALIILDCCHSGSLGNTGNPAAAMPESKLRTGISILAASRPDQGAAELDGHGVFTHLLLGALKGGAADVRGNVSAAAIYGYVEAALGPWDQRPMFKAHASSAAPVRKCEPAVEDSLLRRLPNYFKTENHRHKMDETYEVTHPNKKAENVAIFDDFKVLRDARLLRATTGKDLYWTALEEGTVELTPLGQFYWLLASKGRI